jgi:signal transduction histidine kinase
MISSDAEMLWHLFSNIVNNAIKFRRKGVPGRILVSVQQLDGEVKVSVRDDGIGMDKEDMDRAFSRFYQASASYEGSGVGLTICRMIAQGLGGRILLESEGSGKGLTATVALPSTKISGITTPFYRRHSVISLPCLSCDQDLVSKQCPSRIKLSHCRLVQYN